MMSLLAGAAVATSTATVAEGSGRGAGRGPERVILVRSQSAPEWVDRIWVRFVAQVAESGAAQPVVVPLFAPSEMASCPDPECVATRAQQAAGLLVRTLVWAPVEDEGDWRIDVHAFAPGGKRARQVVSRGLVDGASPERLSQWFVARLFPGVGALFRVSRADVSSQLSTPAPAPQARVWLAGAGGALWVGALALLWSVDQTRGGWREACQPQCDAGFTAARYRSDRTSLRWRRGLAVGAAAAGTGLLLSALLWPNSAPWAGAEGAQP